MLNNNTKLLTYLEGFVTEKRKNLFRQILKNRTRHFTVVLEDIYQQHNSSAVIRSCEIFGIQDVHVIENKYISNVSKNIAKGSQKWLSFHNYKKETNNTIACLNSLKGKGYQLIATSPHHNSCLLHDFDITKKSAFIFYLVCMETYLKFLSCGKIHISISYHFFYFDHQLWSI